jgi:CheY-like chemotaxis protein
MLPRTILIADDDRLLRESLSEVFAGMGCRTLQAGDGRSAITCLTHDHCDLLLSDVDMPDMTGFQLLDWVQMHPPGPATVLMSARADAALERSAKATGALALLTKPVPISTLTGLISSFFDTHVSTH